MPGGGPRYFPSELSLHLRSSWSCRMGGLVDAQGRIHRGEDSACKGNSRIAQDHEACCPTANANCIQTDRGVELRATVTFRLRIGRAPDIGPKSGARSDGWLAHVWDNRLRETVLPNNYTRASERVVLQVLEFVGARSEDVIQIEEIVEATKVNYRTLLRAFERYIGFSPKHYLMLRQINLVYHAIRLERYGSAKIADILSANGVTEFGRFAGQYRS
jgi:AraC-like DNA-binding protein